MELSEWDFRTDESHYLSQLERIADIPNELNTAEAASNEYQFLIILGFIQYILGNKDVNWRDIITCKRMQRLRGNDFLDLQRELESFNSASL